MEENEIESQAFATRAKRALSLQIRDESAGGEDVAGNAAERRARLAAAGALVDDCRPAFVDRQRECIALDDVARVALDRQQAIVDGVTIEAAREALGQDDRDARRDHNGGRDLHRRAAPEVRTGDENVTRAHRRRESRIDCFEQIALENVLIERLLLARRRDDVVGVDVVAHATRPRPEWNLIADCRGDR